MWEKKVWIDIRSFFKFIIWKLVVDVLEEMSMFMSWKYIKGLCWSVWDILLKKKVFILKIEFCFYNEGKGN